MHVDDQNYSVNGKKYRRTLLRNSYRKNGKICHDTVANLSKCSEKEIAAIKLALANKNNLKALEQSSGQPVSTKQGLCIGAVWLLYQLAKRVGIVRAFGSSREAKLCLWMVIASLIGCVSRLSVTRLAQRHACCDILGLDGFCEDDLYSAMDWLCENQKKIEKRLFSDRYAGRIPNLYLYDVTSSYLEGEQNEFGEYGYNRDKKKSKKQIVIGLLADEAGRPISCEVFPGNTQDPETFANQIDKVKRQFGIEHITFVGDRGMIKGQQVKDLEGEDLHYITAITKPQIEALLKSNIIQMELFDKTVCEVVDKKVRYVLRRNPQRAKEIQETRDSKLEKVRSLCQKKNDYLNDHPRAQVDVAVRNVTNLAKKLKIDDWITVKAEHRHLRIAIDEDERQTKAKLDGCYVIKTDLPKKTATKETVHDRYCDLTEVEWAFRTMKTTLLHIRGIFVRKKSRTRAHVFIITLAYLLAYELRRLWSGLNMTIQDGLDELSSLCATEVIIGNVCYQTIPKPRLLGQRLLAASGVTLPDAVPSRHANVYTRKKLVEERRNNKK